MKKKIKIKILARFGPIFDFKLKGKRSRAEPKILQLKLWLEPARLGLITRAYLIMLFCHFNYSVHLDEIFCEAIMQIRDGARSENLGGQVIRRGATVRRQLLLCQNLGPPCPPLPPPLQISYSSLI